MHSISRRSALLGISSIPAVAAPGAALAVAGPLTTYQRAERLHALAEQTSEAFDAWNELFGGSWELQIRAGGHIMYHNIDAERMRTPMTPQERMSKAAKEYIRAAQEIDPTVNDWWQGRAVGDECST